MIENLTAERVWEILMDVMATDNGCDFDWTEEDKSEALPFIRDLMEEGYFMTSEPDDLDGDFWTVFGEATEAPEHFRRNAVAYAGLDAVLNRIFER